MRKGSVTSHPLCIRGDYDTPVVTHLLGLQVLSVMSLMMFSLALSLQQSQAGCGWGDTAGSLLTQVCSELQHLRWSTDLCFHQGTTFCLPNPTHRPILQGSLELKHFILLLLLPVNWPEWVCRAGRAKFGWRSVSFCSTVAFLLIPHSKNKTKPICEVNS